LGFDPHRFLWSLRGLPLFFKNWRKFKMGYSGSLTLMPCLHDWYEEGGTTKNEYFWQDLLVARWIYEAKPRRHVDVGSRVDGFVAHVASFREIEVFDVRPISTPIPGVVFRTADLMSNGLTNFKGEYCDSLSCLHAIEHFGLGRYGDPIDTAGHEKGIANMAKLLQHDGTFYLSAPIGQERVEFNAHRIFDPHGIIRLVESHGFVFQKLTVICNGDVVHEVPLTSEALRTLFRKTYSLGLFVFRKA